VIAKVFVGGMRLLSSFRAGAPSGLKVARVAPRALLGAPLEAIYWNRRNAEAWIRAGERDAAAFKHSIPNCFERK